MFPVITALFLLIPIVEIFLLIQVGGMIGAPWTILLVVLTAVIGVKLLKMQGVSTLTRAQKKMQTGQMPAQEMLEGMGLVVAGAFLLTPGFFTDTVGFLLLLPPTRAWLVSKLVKSFMASGRFAPTSFSSSTPFNSDLNAPIDSAAPKSTKDANIIDGVNYTRED
jgi:UPF0716 protein FxsA|tara:strand:- start:25 stop:519 length:495 start_codon:yes stop_codon:yes gene_type:complete